MGLLSSITKFFDPGGADVEMPQESRYDKQMQKRAERDLGHYGEKFLPLEKQQIQRASDPEVEKREARLMAGKAISDVRQQQHISQNEALKTGPGTGNPWNAIRDIEGGQEASIAARVGAVQEADSRAFGRGMQMAATGRNMEAGMVRGLAAASDNVAKTAANRLMIDQQIAANNRNNRVRTMNAFMDLAGKGISAGMTGGLTSGTASPPSLGSGQSYMPQSMQTPAMRTFGQGSQIHVGNNGQAYLNY